MVNEKCVNYIDEVIVWARDYRSIIDRGRSLSARWGALIGAIIQETDFEGYANKITPTGDPGTMKDSLLAVVGNIDIIASAFDAGIDTNVEKIT